MGNHQTRGSTSDEAQKPKLKRVLTLPLLTLYGLGVTIGAGIYVLVGATAAKAGIYAPISFILAACVVAFTGLSYAELGTRYPVSAGEAAYVSAGFKSSLLATLVGLMVAASGVVSSAAVAIGSAAYLELFVALPPAAIIVALVLLIGTIAVWGIIESVLIAGIFTMIEMAGLAFVVYYGWSTNPDFVSELDRLVPPLELTAWTGIYSAGLLAFFAFVGFEDIANVAEEIRNPSKTLPWAVFLTLIISTLIYVIVVATVVLAVPIHLLAGSDAPLALVFANASPSTIQAFNIIAIIATTNGVLIQIIMASRVIYGLASRGNLPAFLAYVNPITRTPLTATVIIVTVILVLALFFPITELAEITSLIVLSVFCTVNLALLRLKWRNDPVVDEEIFQVPALVPLCGFVTSGLLFLSALI